MSSSDFQREILASGAYRTPADMKRRLPDRVLGGTDIWYYLNVIDCFVRGYFCALRGRMNRRTWAQYSRRMIETAEKCGGRIDVSGARHLAEAPSPPVIAANHMSMLETVILPACVLPFREMAVIVKETLLNYPFLGPILKQLEHIAVSRKSAVKDLRTVLTKGPQALRSGCSVLVFPQATRSVEFDPSRFNTLAVKLAGRANAPIIPAALKTDFLGMGRIIRDFGPVHRKKTIHVKFGASIPPSTPAPEAQSAIVEFITRNLKSWGGAVRERTVKNDSGSSIQPAV
ncbi:MAG: lysophospholipid acyltransferase family protein [Kiritimatiellia bacterium]